MALLEVREVSSGYGQVEALHKVSFAVNQGEVVTLLGTNGAGKTTTLRTLSSLIRPRSGEIWFDGKRIDGLSPTQVVRLGIVHVPEGRRIFPGLTVRDNLILGTSNRSGLPRTQLMAEVKEQLQRFPVLAPLASALGWTLSGGQQQMLAIARGLMGRPRLLMIDEASLGLAPVAVQQVFDTVAEIRESGTTILLVEQNATVALAVADRGYVLDAGSIVIEGTGRELLTNPEVSHAYLGHEQSD